MTWHPISTAPYGEIDIKLACGSVLCGAILQDDGDFWWRGFGPGELFIDPINVTGWRKPDKGPGMEEGEVRWMIESVDGRFRFSHTWDNIDDAEESRRARAFCGDGYRVVRVRIVREEE